jgi:hypothetical protein
VLSYTVTFTESGLPTGKRWSAAFNGVLRNTTATALTFSVHNGSYTYLVSGPSGFTVSGLAPEGTIVVNGSGVSQPVVFDKGTTYSITLHETGLPTGTSWCATVGSLRCTTSASLVIKNLTNGSYAFSVRSVPGFSVTPRSGTLTVAGAAVRETVRFLAS